MKTLTVGELRARMLTLDSTDVSDGAEVIVRVQDDFDGSTMVGGLTGVSVDPGCTEVDALLLDGDVDAESVSDLALLPRVREDRVDNSKLARLVSQCPIGFADGKLITHRGFRDADMIEWIHDMQRIVAMPEPLPLPLPGVPMTPLEYKHALARDAAAKAGVGPKPFSMEVEVDVFYTNDEVVKALKNPPSNLELLVRIARTMVRSCTPAKVGDLVVEVSGRCSPGYDEDSIGVLVAHDKAPYGLTGNRGFDRMREVWDVKALSGKVGAMGDFQRWENAEFLAVPPDIVALAVAMGFIELEPVEPELTLVVVGENGEPVKTFGLRKIETP